MPPGRVCHPLPFSEERLALCGWAFPCCDSTLRVSCSLYCAFGSLLQVDKPRKSSTTEGNVKESEQQAAQHHVVNAMIQRRKPRRHNWVKSQKSDLTHNSLSSFRRALLRSAVRFTLQCTSYGRGLFGKIAKHAASAGVRIRVTAMSVAVSSSMSRMVSVCKVSVWCKNVSTHARDGCKSP